MWKPVAIDWRPENEAKHIAKHGVDFDTASRVFDGPGRHELPDRRKDYSDDRRNTFGMVDGLCINVTFAVEGDAVTIISARAASRRERQRYAESYLGGDQGQIAESLSGDPRTSRSDDGRRDRRGGAERS